MTPINKNAAVFAVLCGLLFSFSPKSIQSDSPNAITEKINEVDIFIYSKPSKKYQVIKDGTIVTVSFKGIDGLVNAGAKIAVKEKADGIIINARNSKYEAIKYE